MLLVSVFAAALLGYFTTVRLGRFLAAKVGRIDLARMTQVIIVLVVLLVLLMTGVPGMLLLLAATLMGLLPPRIGVNRVQLTGCLLLPITLFFFGLEPIAASFLGGAL
jgi:putative membrane protein